MRSILSCLLIALISICHLSAQLPANPLGSNLLRTRWAAVEGKGAKVIYPQGLDSIGLRLTQLIDHRLQSDRSDIGTRTRQVPLLIHPYHVRSNAFVTVGPFRSEFIGISPQYKNMLHWLDELTLHEYRHVEQFANARQGVTKVVGDILGSWAWGGMMALALPRWYFEGDAVIAETALSRHGRGRFPEFLQEYHALLQDSIIYNYEKAAAGSMKDFVPNWYHLGYNMLSYGRQKYGYKLWADVRDDAVRYRGLFYPFGKSVKKHTGQSIKSLYAETMKNLKREWHQKAPEENTNVTKLTPAKKSTVINYSCPLPQSDGSIIAVKQGYDTPYKLIKITPDGTENKLTTMGILLDQSLTTLRQYENKIVWAEQGFHHRRANVTYSDIYIYDLATHSKHRLTHGHRYFSPAFSPDGSEIAVVQVHEDLTQSIAILNADDGSVIRQFPQSLFKELSYPTWIDTHTIAYVLTAGQRNQIMILDTETNRITPLTSPSDDHIAHLFHQDGRIYFAQADGWVSNIFSINIEGNDKKKHSQSLMGSYQPSVLKDKLLFSSFSAHGYDIFSAALQDLPFEKKNIAPLYATVLQRQPTSTDLASHPHLAASHSTHKHSRWQGLLNPHSLIPEWSDQEISLTLLSDNVLGTLSANAKAIYNYNENTMRYSAGLTYAELYPEISINYQRANRSSVFFAFSTPADSILYQDIYIRRWKEDQISAAVRIPYNFSRGPMSNRINLTARYTYNHLRFNDSDDSDVLRDTISIRPDILTRLQPSIVDPLTNRSLHQLDLRAQVSMFRYRAIQNINPRFGLYLEGRYRYNLGNTVTYDPTLLIRADLYLPGIMRNHSFYINSAYQSENLLSNYRFSDQFLYPRGYNSSLRRDRFYKVGFNYSFPIAYPDLALGGWAFWKRLRANVFYDIGRVDIRRYPFTAGSRYFNSAGIELGFDVRLLRLVEADFRLRYSYLMNKNFAPNEQQHQFDFFVISLRAN